MRIARILTRMNLGGPARQTLAADPRLVARGHDLRLFAGLPEAGEGDLFEHYVSRGLDAVRIAGMRRGLSPARDLVAAARLRRELSRFRPDVVHTHASKAGVLGRHAVRGIGHSDRVARVHTFHGHVLEGYFPPVVARRFVALERRLASATDRIVAVSHATADDLVRLGIVAEERVVVVPPGIELERLLAIERGGTPGGALRASMGVRPEDVAVGVVGRLAGVKRPERALEVFALLAERYPGMHLAFVGDGDQRRALERRIRGLAEPARRRVHLLGNREDMEPVWSALDLALSTSDSEGLPVSLIEAGAAGLAAVARAVGGVAEVIAHERTGWLADSVDELAYGLARFLADRSEARAAGARARLRVAERYSADRLADRLEELYTVVVEERRQRVGGRP